MLFHVIYISFFRLNTLPLAQPILDDIVLREKCWVRLYKYQYYWQVWLCFSLRGFLAQGIISLAVMMKLLPWKLPLTKVYHVYLARLRSNCNEYYSYIRLSLFLNGIRVCIFEHSLCLSCLIRGGTTASVRAVNLSHCYTWKCWWKWYQMCPRREILWYLLQSSAPQVS